MLTTKRILEFFYCAKSGRRKATFIAIVLFCFVGLGRSDQSAVAYTSRSILSLAYEGISLRAEQKIERNAIKLELIKRAIDGPNGPVWGMDRWYKDRRCKNSGEFDAFSDGTCNEPSIGYLFQSTLAMLAILELSEINDKETVSFIRKGFEYWWGLSRSPAQCSRCVIIPYSNSKNDHDRHVLASASRLAAVGAKIYSMTRDSSILTILDRLITSTQFEVERGNRGYLSVFDRNFNSRELDRTENHILAIVFSYLLVGKYTNDRRAFSLAEYAYKSWANCSWGLCQSPQVSCAFWAGKPDRCIGGHAFGHCLLRTRLSEAERRCAIALTKKRPNSPYERLLTRRDLVD